MRTYFDCAKRMRNRNWSLLLERGIIATRFAAIGRIGGRLAYLCAPKEITAAAVGCGYFGEVLIRPEGATRFRKVVDMLEEVRRRQEKANAEWVAAHGEGKN